MSVKPATPEAFSSVLQEKLDELDQAAQHEALMAHDEVELLRLQAAYLVSGTDGKPWHTGAAVHFQGNLSQASVPAPTLDVSYPARPPRPLVGPERVPPAPPGRQGRRIPR